MSRHVLLIDDEPDIREVAAASLELLAGWRVTAASSGAEGLALARSARPDVVVVDMMMPVMDGPAVVEALRADPEIASIPVVFLTAKVQAADLEQLDSLGVAGVVAKPFDPTTLATEIAARLGWDA